MKCNSCGNADTSVIDSRLRPDGSIRRRRECLKCRSRITTIEVIADDVSTLRNDIVEDALRQAIETLEGLRGKHQREAQHD